MSEKLKILCEFAPSAGQMMKTVSYINKRFFYFIENLLSDVEYVFKLFTTF